MLALCGLLTASAPGRAFAEWQFTPFVGFTFAGDTNLNLLEEGPREQHWNLGGTVRLVGSGPFGVESVILYVPGFFEGSPPPTFGDPQQPTIIGSRTLALMGNIVLTTPRAWNEYGLRPYVSGGAGLLHVNAVDQEPSPFSTRANLPGYNVGGGAVGFLTDRVGLRFDLRYFRTLPPGREPNPDASPPLLTFDTRNVRLRYWTGSVGVVLKY